MSEDKPQEEGVVEDPELVESGRESPFSTGAEGEGGLTETPAIYRGGEGRVSLTPSEFSNYSTYTNSPEGSKISFVIRNGTIFVVWIILFIGVYIATKSEEDPRKPRGLPYCDSEVPGTFLSLTLNQTDCQACDIFGYCLKGILLECQYPFVIEKAICVQKEKYSIFSMEMISKFKKKLAKMAGNFECGKSEENGLYRTDLSDEAFEVLQGRFPDVNVSILQEEFEEKYFKMFWSILYKSQMNFEVDINDSVNEFNGTEFKDWFIHSTNPQFTYMCRIKLAIIQFKYLVVFGVICVIIMGVFKYLLRLKKRRDQNIADIASIVLTRIRKKSENGVSVELMKEEIEKIQFNESVDIGDLWDEVVMTVERDSRVAVGANDQEEKLWEWNSIGIEEEFDSPELRRSSIVTPQLIPTQYAQRKLFRASL